MKLNMSKTMCAITKKVVSDFNTLTDRDFLYKYACTKSTYYRRVMKYGDPYMNAPLAKIGKFLKRIIS